MTTIISVTPDSGISIGRYIVILEGTDFRLPDLVPGSDTAQESVRIWVDNVQVPKEDVFVRTTTKIEFRMAASYRTVGREPDNTDIPVDVKIQNVDANGDLIIGSDFTLPEGFSYIKIDKDSDSIMQKVSKILMLHLRRNLPIPVYFLSHVDYSTGSASPVANGPEQAEEPALFLVGPRRASNTFGTQRVRNTWPVSDPESRWLPRAVDLFYDLTFVCSKKVILNNLIPRIDTLIDHIPCITLTIMGKEYKMDTWMTTPLSTENNILFDASLQQASGTLKIESVPLETDIIRYNKELNDINITIGV